jgi:hypothetical protein
MVDLSERGARVQVDSPPRAGASVILEWMCYDAICKVVWATEDACGLIFEKEISSARVLEVQQHRENSPARWRKCRTFRWARSATGWEAEGHTFLPTPAGPEWDGGVCHREQRCGRAGAHHKAT